MSVIKSYNSDKYNLIKEVERIFQVEEGSLDELHSLRKDLMPTNELTFENETRTDFHQVFYGVLNSDEGETLKNIYKNFIEDVVSPIFDESFLYQKFPSFRVHIPNDQAVHKWHYDSDEDHNHPSWEINFQLALTKMFDSNAMWLESVPSLGDFSPIEMETGEFCIFYGNKCRHGNKKNLTNKTRVSMDFRVLPFSKYDDSDVLESVTANRKFAVGHYYDLYNK